jgi:hypothetical protein
MSTRSKLANGARLRLFGRKRRDRRRHEDRGDAVMLSNNSAMEAAPLFA